MADHQTTADAEQRTLCGAYHPLDGMYDEMCTGPGESRPHWSYLRQSLETLGPVELRRRYGEARRLIRDNDVTYNVYSDPLGIGRPWDLDLIPLLLGSEEWAQIESGLIQRAELLNLLLKDIYGPRRIIAQGIIPPELLYAFPSFLRPCDGMCQGPVTSLPLYAADLARLPDGQIRVIADRTQAPSGAGYALENRIVMSRVMPSLFRDSHAHRLAPFFRAMRNAMNALAPSGVDEPRIVLLSPGVGNESYFEHAYLANYLGYTLVEGADLTVRDDHVWIRTLGHLERVDVIVRRVDDEFCDPLELRGDSFLGVPGLLQVARLGNVRIANPLGSGVLQNPALMAYMPALCRHFLGEDLQLQNVQTWWCGDDQDRRHVLANLEHLVIKPLSPGKGPRTLLASSLDNEARDRLVREIEARPHLFCAQERAELSAAPVLSDSGALEPRHVVLRSYLVSQEESYTVMPGGLTRVSASPGDYLVSSQRGGASKDTWVLASEPEKQETLIVPARHVVPPTRRGGDVPSRVAENLFWLGRYAERAEGLVRLLRVVQLNLADSLAFASAVTPDSSMGLLLRAVTAQTRLFPGFIGEGAESRFAAPEPELLRVITSGIPGSLSQTLGAMLMAARTVRDRLSVDTLRVINDVDIELRGLTAGPQQHLNDVDDELDNLVTALVGFSGLTNENMTHEQGWRFLEIGRRMERALHTASLLQTTLVPVIRDDEASQLLESVLSIIDSLMTYKRNFPLGYEVSGLLDLALLDEKNPRSIGYQLLSIQKHTGYLPVDRARQHLSGEERIILELLTELRVSDVDALSAADQDQQARLSLDQLLNKLQFQLVNVSNVLTASYFQKVERLHQLVQIRAEG